jgi:lipopolysaccharide transport system ATP-binding protein
MDKPIAISVTGISKCYRLRHQQQRQRYVALRDVIAEKAKRAAGAVKSLFGSPKSTEGSASMEDFWALRDVDFQIQQGEAVGIIGRNGAGKSTLLKLLSRITEPTRGEIRMRGRVGSLLEVGTGFHPELTGRENIFLNGAILGMGRIEIKRKFDEIVAFAEVEKFLDTPVKRYSSGMYVRLAFSVAAHLEPEILILDEVLAVGDAAFQKKCFGKMGEVSGSGRTILFVSHNMGAVMSLCQKAIWLDSGRVKQVGPSREVINNYLTCKAALAQDKIDLSQCPRSIRADSRLRLQSIEWISGLPLQHGEPARARLMFQVNAPVCDVTVGVGFSTIEGVRLLTYETDFQDGFRPSFSSPGMHTVEMEIPALALGPAIYALDIGCRSGDAFTLDYLPALSQIEVISGPKTPGYIVRNDAGVRLESHWVWNSERPKVSSIEAGVAVV